MLKLKTDPYGAVCTSPKITSLLSKDFPKDIQSNLEYNLDKYCLKGNYEPIRQLSVKILEELDFKTVIIKKIYEKTLFKLKFYLSFLMV